MSVSSLEEVLAVEQRKACPSHPGEILKKLYIGGSDVDFCIINDLELPVIRDLIKKNIPCDNKLSNKLADATNTTPELWLNLQDNYDKWMEANKKTMTNFDYIKTINPEDFVSLLFDWDTANISLCMVCIHNNACNDDCRGGITEWLKQSKEIE